MFTFYAININKLEHKLKTTQQLAFHIASIFQRHLTAKQSTYITNKTYSIAYMFCQDFIPTLSYFYCDPTFSFQNCFSIFGFLHLWHSYTSLLILKIKSNYINLALNNDLLGIVL